MARHLLLVATLLASGARAAPESFDIVQFTAPAGTRSVQSNVVTFTDATPTTYAVYGVYRALPSSGDPARDFAQEWRELVASAPGSRVTSALKTETSDWPGGWRMTTGAAGVWSERGRNAVALLSVFTGHGLKVSVLVRYNDDRYRAAIDRFLAGIRLEPPTAGAAPSRPEAATGPAPAPAAEPATAGPPPAAARDGFSFTAPAGFTERSGWHVATRVENRGGGDERTSALVRMPGAVAAQGGMGDALRALWRQHVPVELRDRAGAMVYRRYVGDGVPAWFVSGKGREKGRQADSLFTLHLLDCGSFWQPVVVAQTYEEPGNPYTSTVAFTADLSWGASAQMAEPFLASLRCPGGRGRPLVERSALVGPYSFGSSASQLWVNVYSGATSMTAVSYGGTLDLKDDGSYDYRFQGASGVVGAMNIATENSRGRWMVRDDRLVLTRSDGNTSTYRIAGLTTLPTGEKAAVFMSRLDLPVNATTVTNGGDYFVARPGAR